MTIPIGRREFIAALGGTAAWPLAARAQQPSTLPVIGFLNSASRGPSGPFRPFLDAFHQGLNEGGYVEGRNVVIEYRWAGGQFARLPELAADLVARRVSLIAATGGAVSARAAKGATSTIPILFIGGQDPVADGIVTSLNQPGGNATGVALRTLELMTKRLELLRELVPHAAAVALLVNPTDVTNELEAKDVEAMMRAIGGNMVLLKASAENDFEPTFASAARQQADALLVSPNPFFTARRAQIVTLAARHGMPAAYPWREYVDAGGADELWPQHRGRVSSDWSLCWPHPQGRKAKWPPSADAHQVRADHQPKGCAGPPPDHTPHHAYTRRRGDRMSGPRA
jgi:putative ABC transport system substrate-binding protein